MLEEHRRRWRHRYVDSVRLTSHMDQITLRKVNEPICVFAFFSGLHFACPSRYLHTIDQRKYRERHVAQLKKVLRLYFDIV
jgi:hypothetical protein